MSRGILTLGPAQGTIVVLMKTIKLRGSDYTKYMKNNDHYRARTKKSLFDAYGPVRIAGPSGRFLSVVHSDPGEAPEAVEVVEQQAPVVSEEKMLKQQDSMKRMAGSGIAIKVPSPKSCKCAAWPVGENEVVERDERGKQTSHRRACAYRKRWELQSFRHQQSNPATKVLEPVIHAAQRPTNSSVLKPARLGKSNPTQKLKGGKLEKIPSPEGCPKCGEWTQPRKHREAYPNQHHLACPYFKKYLSLSAVQKAAGIAPEPAKPEKNRSKVFLFDLKTQEQVREAERDEVEEAAIRLRDEGAALCRVGENEYFVMHEDGEQIQPAEAEAVAPEAPEDNEPEEVAIHSDTERPEPPSAEEQPSA